MMREERDERDLEIALFRHGVLGDLVHLPRGPGSGLYELLKEKASQEYKIPGSSKKTIAAETIRDWLKQYRVGGFEALFPKRRSDSGFSRKLSQDVTDVLCHIKEQDYDKTVKQVIDAARNEYSEVVSLELVLPESTVHRLLSRAGLMKKRPKDPSSKDQRRFAYEKAGELWMSDVMHGPAMRIKGQGPKKHKTYLIAFIDDATRVIPYAEFCLSEKTSSFLPVLRKALMRRGIPKRLYVDNGAAYTSKQLASVCAHLGVTLIHARPYHAAGKGKIERFFRRLRQQFLKECSKVDSLDELNQRLRLWLEKEYHRTAHRGLNGISPFDAWCAHSDQVRLCGPELDLNELFLFDEKRKVHKDRTISLKGTAYEVDAALVGETVIVKYDPSKPGSPVHIWHKGEKVETAKAVDLYANCRVKRNHESKIIEADSSADKPASALKLSGLKNRK